MIKVTFVAHDGRQIPVEIDAGLTAREAALFNDAAEEIRRLLHQFAAGFLREAERTHDKAGKR